VLLFDLDNTLCKRAATHLSDRLRAFLIARSDMGFDIGILTNRRRNAQDPIIHALAELVPILTAAGKPSRRGFQKLLARMGASAEHAVMIGDRKLTDILGANRTGLHSIRVTRKSRK